VGTDRGGDDDLGDTDHRFALPECAARCRHPDHMTAAVPFAQQVELISGPLNTLWPSSRNRSVAFDGWDDGFVFQIMWKPH
jgi:hypothetical protein